MAKITYATRHAWFAHQGQDTMIPFFPYFEKPVQEWKNIFPDKNFHVGNALIQIPLEPEKTKIVTLHPQNSSQFDIVWR